MSSTNSASGGDEGKNGSDHNSGGEKELKVENDLLRSNLASLKKELESFKELQARIDQLSEEKVKFESKFLKLQEYQCEVIDQKFVLEDEMEVAKAEIAHLQTANKEQASQLELAQVRLSQHDPNELETLKATNVTLEGKVKHHETLIQALESTVTDLHRKLEEKASIMEESKLGFASQIEDLVNKLKISAQAEEDLKKKFESELRTRINEERIQATRIKDIIIEDLNQKLKVVTGELEFGTLKLNQVQCGKDIENEKEISILRAEVQGRDRIIAELKGQLLLQELRQETPMPALVKVNRLTQTGNKSSLHSLNGSFQLKPGSGAAFPENISDEWKNFVEQQLNVLSQQVSLLTPKNHKLHLKNVASKPLKSSYQNSNGSLNKSNGRFNSNVREAPNSSVKNETDSVTQNQYNNPQQQLPVNVVLNSKVPLLSIIPNANNAAHSGANSDIDNLKPPKIIEKKSAPNAAVKTVLKRSASTLNISLNNRDRNSSVSTGYSYSKSQNQKSNINSGKSSLNASKETESPQCLMAMPIIQNAEEAKQLHQAHNKSKPASIEIQIETNPNQLYRQQHQHPLKKFNQNVTKTNINPIQMPSVDSNKGPRRPPILGAKENLNLRSQSQRQTAFSTRPAVGSVSNQNSVPPIATVRSSGTQVFTLLSAKRLLNVVSPSRVRVSNEELQNQAVPIYQNYHGSSKLIIDEQEFTINFWFSLRMAMANSWTPDQLKICFPKIRTGNKFESYGNCFVIVKFMDDQDCAFRHISYEFQAEKGSCTKPQMMHLNCDEATSIKDNFYQCTLEMNNYTVGKNGKKTDVRPALATACKIEVELFLMTRVASFNPSHSAQLLVKHRNIFSDFKSIENERKHKTCRKIHFRVKDCVDDGDVIWGDTCLISAYTPVFEIMCQKNFEEDKTHQPDVFLPNVTREIMEQFINFTQGLPIVDSDVNTVCDLLEFAIQYFIPDLAQICYEKLTVGTGNG